jgi:uncharacterized membrane protein
MATLTVFKFASAGDAEQALDTLHQLQQRQVVTILDAAIVTWPKGRSRPRTRQASAANNMLDGAFWGMLFGVIFFMPVLGVAVGAEAGMLNGALVDVGIDDNFIYHVRSKVTEGTSALFILSSDAVIDRLMERSKETKPELIATYLAKEQEAKLRNLFAQTEMKARTMMY